MLRPLLPFLLLLASVTAFAENSLTVVRMTPQGDDVAAPSQIVFQFDRDVVPIGKMDRLPGEIPVEISPHLECEWRWIDMRTLSCFLSGQHKAAEATKYGVLLKPGLKALDGAELKVPFQASFVTSRARIQYYWFREWTSPGTPKVNVTFSNEIEKSTAEQHLFYFSKGKRYPALIEQPEGYTSTTTFLVSPKEELPIGAEAELRVEPGIKNLSGGEPSNDKRSIVKFNTFPEFEFLGVRCTTNIGTELRFVPERTTTDGKLCNPLASITLQFSAPVLLQKDAYKLSPNPIVGEAEQDAYSRLSGPVEKEYPVYLPYGLKAATKYELSLLKIVDEFGRSLKQAKSVRFATDHRLPRVVVPDGISTLESNESTSLPVAVQNVDSLELRYDLLSETEKSLHNTLSLKVDNIQDLSYYFPLKIRQITGRSGVLFGTLAGSTQNNSSATLTREFVSQVTPYAIHVKQAHRNTLVWVTSLATGQPVSDATVQIRKLRPDGTLSQISEKLGEARTDSLGLALLPGTDEIDPELVSASGLTECTDGCEGDPKAILYLVKGKEGLGFVSATSDFELYPQGGSDEYISYNQSLRHQHIKSWGMTAQGVYRLGDTVQFKIFVRDELNRSLGAAPSGNYAIKVVDPLGATIKEFKNLKLSEFGTLAGEFELKKSGAVGNYRFELSADFTTQVYSPLSVLVSDFTPAPFKVTSEVRDPHPVTVGDEVSLSSKASLYAGGPYSNSKYRFVARLQGKGFDELPQKLSGFYFELFRYGQLEENYSTEGMLDQNGEMSLSFKVAESSILYGNLRLESAVSDDRGRYIATEKLIPFSGRDRFVGLRTKDWLMKVGAPYKIEGAILDRNVKNVVGEPLAIEIFSIVRTAHRVKGAGNAYLTQYDRTENLVRRCELTSGESPASCSLIPTVAGEYKIKSTVKDANGKEHSTELYRYCQGKGNVVWALEEGNSLDIQPEKKSYSVGETAKFVVKNPFPGSLALVTVERIGTIESRVEKLADAISTISLPVTEEMIPGFYLSVVLHSPRVEKPLEGEVDLGKPLARMGYAAIKVNDDKKLLKVELNANKEEYRPGDKVTLAVDVKTPKGARKLEETELAIAVVDEAVFDLLTQGMQAYDPVSGLYSFGALDLRNFNDLITLVGRRKFEKKGANSGGDGGSEADMRSVEKYVAYWNSAIKLSAAGKTEVSFNAPDNLTAWKAIGVVATKQDRFGVGSGLFKVNKPLEVRAALPNLLRDNDSVVSKFTLLNRTTSAKKAKVVVDVSGPLREPARLEQELELEPFQRREILLPLAMNGSGDLVLKVSAVGEGDFSDSLQVKLPVLKSFVTESASSSASFDGSDLTLPLALPADVRTDVGGIDLKFSPSVIGNLDGAFGYLRDYPYLCWEQRLSRAILASHYAELSPYLAADSEWKGSEDVAQDQLNIAAQFQTPSGGMSYYGGGSDRADPYLSAFTALGFNWLSERRNEVPKDVESALHQYLLEFLSKDTHPTFYTTGMASSVRAVALKALAERGLVGLPEIERYYGAVPQMFLFGKSHYLMAAIKVGASKAIIENVTNQLLASGNETSGKYSFSESISDEYNRLLTSRMRENCAVLSALLVAPESIASSVVPKLAAHISEARAAKGHYENTQDNLFCSRALIEFAKKYEHVTPNYSIVSKIGDSSLGEISFRGFKESAVTKSLPLLASDLLGKNSVLSIHKSGPGRVYLEAKTTFAYKEPKRTAVNAGIEVVREYSVERDKKWVSLKNLEDLKAGDIVRVDLYVVLPGARTFVVVDDPIPAGLEPVNRDLKTSSDVDASKGDFKASEGSFFYRYDGWRDYGYDFWSFYHKELRHDSARFYSEYLPPGPYRLSYVAQVIGAGVFEAPPTKVMEMYHPETFGLSEWSTLASK